MLLGVEPEAELLVLPELEDDLRAVEDDLRREELLPLSIVPPPFSSSTSDGDRLRRL